MVPGDVADDVAVCGTTSGDELPRSPERGEAGDDQNHAHEQRRFVKQVSDVHPLRQSIGIYLDDLARSDCCDRRFDFMQDRQDVLHAISDVDDDDCADADLVEILLKTQALIGREDDREPAVDGSSKQNAVT